MASPLALAGLRACRSGDDDDGGGVKEDELESPTLADLSNLYRKLCVFVCFSFESERICCACLRASASAGWLAEEGADWLAHTSAQAHTRAHTHPMGRSVQAGGRQRQSVEQAVSSKQAGYRTVYRRRQTDWQRRAARTHRRTRRALVVLERTNKRTIAEPVKRQTTEKLSE